MLFLLYLKNKTDKKEHNMPQKIEKQLAILDRTRKVDFEPNRGAPEQIIINRLIFWTAHSNLGVKYFSGTANYKKNININGDWLKKEAELWLDLSDVKNLAEVFVNGEYLGTLWRNPFRIDITKALKSGNNNLEIRVTNLWVNRFIGDEQLHVQNKITYTTMPFYNKDSPPFTFWINWACSNIKKKQC